RSSEAARVVWGWPARNRSKLGVRASAIALWRFSSRQPKPASTKRTTGPEMAGVTAAGSAPSDRDTSPSAPAPLRCAGAGADGEVSRSLGAEPAAVTPAISGPVVLFVLAGFGCRDEKRHNAIA